jgi:ribose-phosphate pyrophosphokinase
VNPARGPVRERGNMQGQLKIFSGRANVPLAMNICEHLDIKPGDAEVRTFADGEIRVNIRESVRGSDAFVIQSTQPPADNLLELLLMIDALRRASAERITAVIPYFGYARQDRKDKPRVPISAKLIANLIERAGADRVLTMELHAEQIQGFFDIPVDHLYSTPVLVDFFLKRGVEGCTVVAPDTGRANRARGFATRLMENMPLAVIDKRRPEPNKAVVMNVVGEVEGLDAIIFDDMVDTGKTLILAARALLKHGARSVMAVATHAVFSGDAVKKIQQSPLDEMIVTDTLPLPRKKQIRKIRVLPVASLFADTILRTHRSESVSSLFM